MEARGANDTALNSVSVNVANKQVVHHTGEAVTLSRNDGRRGAVKIGSSVEIGDVAPDFELEDSPAEGPPR